MVYMFLSVVANYVSLPGAGTSPTEQQQTILEVLNNKIVQQQQQAAEGTSTETATAGTSTTQPTVEEEDATNATTHEVIASAVNVPLNEVEDDLVSNSQSTTNTESSLSNESATSQIPYSVAAAAATSEGTTTESTIQRPTNKTETVSDTEATKEETTLTTPNADRQQSTNSATSSGHSVAQGYVLDIESHLIETYKDYQVTDESVGINELPPQQDELTAGTSKVETDVNVRTVIEVEPAGAISRKPIEVFVRTSRAQRADSESYADDIGEVKATPEVIVTAGECEEQKTKAGVKRSTNSEAEKELKTQVQAEEHSSELPADTSDAIKATAERLVNEIEREVLEALRECECAQAEVKVEATKNALETAAQKLNNNNDDLPCQRLDERDIKEDEKTEQATSLLDEISNSLTQKVDAQLSEVTSILKSSKQSHVALQLSGVNGEALKVDVDQTQNNELKIVNVPSPKTPLDEEERKRFLESLPHLDSNAEAQKLADDCKREYYQSLKKYLIEREADRPPVPLQTYRWEDLRRAKERGGYPWTHLYKRPLGPDEEPEIVLLLRKSQEFRFVSESPKSLKKVRIDEQVIIKQPERYIQELSEAEEDYPQSAPEDEESHSLRSESISCVSDSVLATGKPRKSTRLDKIRGYLRRRKGGRTNEDAQSLPCASNSSSRRHSQENITQPAQPPNPQILLNGNNTEQKHCYPIMKKLKSMADRQKKRLNIKRIHLGKDEKIVLGEETKILKLKKSPKAERGEIPHFIEKQDSDDVLEIMELDESPSRKRRDDGRQEDERQEIVQAIKDDSEQMDTNQAEAISIVVPDEIIEIPQLATNISEQPTTRKEAEATQPPEATVSEPAAVAVEVSTAAAPPKKAPRLRREHVYEEIESEMPSEILAEPPKASVGLLELAAVEALKESLAKQDNTTFKHIEEGAKSLPLDRMGSSEEEQIATATAAAAAAADKPAISLLAPLSSVDSTSSDEDRNRAQLSPVSEESEAASVEDNLRIIDDNEPIDLKPAIKKEVSPAPSDKKVTFSHVEDEAEPHREDIELPTEVQEEAAQRKKWTNMSVHEYEPISAPAEADGITTQLTQSEKSNLARNIAMLHEDIKATDGQQDLDESYISSAATTPRTESRTDYEIHTSQVDSSALEELPLKAENRKKSFMASAQDRTRKMQAGIKSQAGKIKTKLRTPAKKPASSSPKAKERKRFKTPEFSKIKMPEIKRPDMSKLKDFKRPEFTKFNKPDMSKFKLPEKFSTLKLKRSKSFKENETHDEELENGAQPATDGAPAAQPHKKMFDFNFGTYPRAFRKKKPLPAQESLGTETGTEGVSVIPSTETQPSQESSNSPQGDRGPGPVRSRWADKFSDVSYNDSEGSRYRRYGSEQESFDRESSLERRMKDDLDESESVAQEMGILGGVADTKQFAEFDEENRAIHEISKMRAGEFRRRPMVHQDSDLRSEDSKDVEGWTEKEIEKNKLLRKAELEAEGSYLKYTADDVLPPETQSTASSGKKVVMEEIDDDEFFLRKRGVSEDNIELRRYISNAIREGYDRPLNTLEHVGQPNEYRDYDIPPPKPKRLHKTYQPQDVSQDFESQRSEYGDDLSMSQNGSDYYNAPKRPLRKGRSRSKYSVDSQEFPVAESMRHEPYFDDDEEYLRPPRNSYKEAEDDTMEMNDLDIVGKQVFPAEPEGVKDGAPPPQAPRRRKRDARDNSMDSKDSYMNGFGGRSVSNTRLQPTEDVIVYRTEHEYPIPIDATEKFEPTVTTRKSRSINRYEEDDRTSRGADSLGYEEQEEIDAEANVDKDKFVIDMMENDGYAIVRKDHMPKPTPPARRKKFSRSPGERFASISSGSAKSATPPPPERPPPPRAYTPSTMEEPVPPRRKSITSLELAPQILEDDYEEPEALQQERPESPRDLQSGEIINKMKFRPLPPPPRPPREKRQRAESKGSAHSTFVSPHERDLADERLATSSTADSYDPTDVDLEEEETRLPEVEVSTQTDPLPDDFECEEFEITEDMRIIEPRINSMRKTLNELLREEELKIKSSEDSTAPQLTEEEQLARGLQRFRDANQRSMSERSRASSQADRSKSQSRPPTPSAVVIERRVSTPIPSQQAETLVEASLIVRPIDDLDLEEEALRREGLLTDSSQQSKSDVEAPSQDEEEESKLGVSDYSIGPSSEELNAALDELRTQGDSTYEEEKGESVEAESIKYSDDVRASDDETFSRKSYERYLLEETSGKEDEEELETKSATEEKLSLQLQTEIEDFEALPTASEDEQRISEIEEAPTDDEHAYEQESPIEIKETNAQETATEKEHILAQEQQYDYDEDYSSRQTEKTEDAAETVLTENQVEAVAFEEPPLPPPRRKSTTAVEVPPLLALMEEPSKELTPIPMQTAAIQPPPQPQLPAHLGDLEVERLRVHALQAGQIMVSQLHGTQISAEELECKSGNLIVKNIALPEGFIEDIVERVRTTDRQQLLTVETQTSLQASSEERSPVREVVPPPKPPRQRDLEASKRPADTADEIALQQLRNYDEETQTDPMTYPTHHMAIPPPPPVYTTTEYLQSLQPMGYYPNLRRADEQQCGTSPDSNEPSSTLQRRPHHHHHHHHHRHHRRCDSSCSECDDYDEDLADREETRSRSHSRRSRSSTRPPTEPQTLAKAGKQFMSACSLSLVQLLNRVTAAVRGGDPDKQLEGQVHHIPTLVALFVVISFSLIVYMLSGRSVHTHHWDFFNPPGNGARQ